MSHEEMLAHIDAKLAEVPFGSESHREWTQARVNLLAVMLRDGE